MILIHDFFPGQMHRYPLKYCDILKANGFAFEIVNCQQADFWKKASRAELFLFFLGQTTRHLEMQRSLLGTIDKAMKVPCFPDWQTAWHFDNKVAQYYLLRSRHLPAAESWVFWDKEEALAWARQTEYPVVFKLKGGAGSLNVVKVDSCAIATTLINKMFGPGIANGSIPGSDLYSVFRKDVKKLCKRRVKTLMHALGLRHGKLENLEKERHYALFQKFLPGNGFDTRVTVIGGKAFAYRRFNRPGDFRSSGSGNFDVSPEQINLGAVSIGFEVSKKLGFKTMAYDFLLDGDQQLRINEMSCQFIDWVVHSCPGFWDEELNFHPGHYWPQYTQLQHILGHEDLIQPDFPLYKGSQNLISY